MSREYQPRIKRSQLSILPMALKKYFTWPWACTHGMSLSTKPAQKAFVVSEEGINIIDLYDLENTGIPTLVSPFEGGTFDSDTAGY